MTRKLTFMIIPEGGEKVFSRTIPSHFFKIAVVAMAILMIFMISVTIMYSRLAAKAARSAILEEENHRLREYFARVVEIEKSFQKNQELTARLAELAGVDLADIKGPQAIDFDSLGLTAKAQQPDTSIAMVPGRDTLTPDQMLKQSVPYGRPAYGWPTNSFRAGGDNRHTGIDFALKEGASISATAAGIVEFAGWEDVLGNLVIIDHQNGYKTFYAHNSKVLVEKDAKVLRGDIVALSGNTGHSTAPHLHYSIMKDGVLIDPMPFMDR